MRRWLERVIFAAGLATIGVLLWRFDPGSVWGQVSQIGWLGLLIVVAFQLFDHGLNAIGWRFAFFPDDSARLSLPLLIKVRVAGDGVNYLTPSASIAGELIRPMLLGPVVPEEAKNASVVIAKLAQGLGQAAFIVLGIVFVVQGRLDFLSPLQRGVGLGASVLTASLIALTLWVLAGKGRFSDWVWSRAGALSAMRGLLRGYLARHPGRFALSILFFALGYAWGALEVLLICRFMGLPLPLATALAVEILSNVIDAMLFMVPAKVGTQEAGKAAIFHGLGYGAGPGLAFGLIRHTRELCWASAGFLIYALSRRAAPGR